MRVPLALLGCAAFLLVLLAGCAQPLRPVPVDGLEPATGPPAGLWVTHTTGCGFCGGTNAPWAETTVLYHDGHVLWFSFRPPGGMEGDEWDGVEVPPEHEALRPLLEGAVAMLGEDDVYWLGPGDARVYDARFARLPDGERGAVRMRVEGMAEGLRDAPPLESSGCDDCSWPQVQVATPDGVRFGAVMERGRHGEGTGNVEPGGAWDVIEEQMRALRDAARPAQAQRAG